MGSRLQRSVHLALCTVCLLTGAPAIQTAKAQAQAPATSATPSITRNIPYATDPTGTYLADLYTPAGPGPFPAIVLIHGGSWRSGRKTELRKLAADLAAKGYLCFSIDYDTHPRSFPISWQESRDAVSFLRAHTAQYHLDPQRIAALGTSAGGQLAALLAVAPQGPDIPATGTSPDPHALIPIQAAVLFNGGYNLHPNAYLLRRYLGGRCSVIPQICDDASPDNHIAPGAPPIFVGHGTHDHLIPYSQATDFVALLQKTGDPVTPFAATGAGHSYWRSKKWYVRNLDAAESFLATAMPPA